MVLINCHIPEYQQAGSHLQHDPKQMRKLLLHKSQINKLLGAVSRQGYTIVPLRLYFNSRGMVKLEIGLAKGKQLHDKRQTEKNRDWQRDKSRIMKDKGEILSPFFQHFSCPPDATHMTVFCIPHTKKNPL